MIQNSFELFEEVSAYSIMRSEKQCLESELFPQLGFIIDGISDFQLFTNQIQEKISNKLKIIKIFDGSAFISFKSDINYFNEQIKPELLISHYNIRSIFLKNDSLLTVLADFNNINENIFYLYYYSDFQSHTNYYSPKAEEVKISSSNPKKYLYGFANFSDLIESYADLVGKIWPIFAIYPSKVKKGQIQIQKEMWKNINFSTKFKSFYPTFSPLKFLYYLCFVEKNPPKPERKLNVSEFYSINKIRDVQISHLYSDSTIRTFLGFDTKFRCFLVLDYLIHSNEKNQLIFDLKFVNEPNFSIQNSINSNLYYLELRSVFDSSILFSINFKESFNFFNDSDNSSSFLSFENQKDLLDAKQLFLSSLNNDFLFKNMRIIENTDFSLLFKDLQPQSDLFYIMFQLKVLNKKQKLPNFTALFKGSKIIRKDCICTLDNKSYIIVGFSNFQRRNEAFQNLKQSKFLITLKSYLPEKMRKKKNLSLNTQKQNKEDEIKPKIDDNPIQPKMPLFHPKEGLFYIYFQEFQKSKLNYPSNVVRPLFGLQNIADLQRNYFLPDDTIEYTFVGFEKLEHLQKVIKDSSSRTNPLVTNILNNRIFDYQNRQEIILKVNQNNDYENRFSYHVEDNKNDPFSIDTKLKNNSNLNKNDNNSELASERNITNDNDGFTNKNQTKNVDTNKNNNNFDNNSNNNLNDNDSNNNLNDSNNSNNNLNDNDSNNNLNDSNNSNNNLNDNDNDSNNNLNDSNNSNNKENNINDNTNDIDNFNDSDNIKTNQTNINHSNDINNHIKSDNNSNSIPNNDYNSNKGSNSNIERDTKTEIEIKPVVNKSGKKKNKNNKKKIESKNDDNQNDENIIFNKFQNADTTKYIIDLKKYKKVATSVIGSGSYGSVYLVENINTHKKYAAKVKRDQKYDDFIQEIKFYTTFQNPLILSLHGYSINDFDNKPKLTLILEYMPNNSLEDFLNKTPKFINSVKSKKYIILFGMISALAYLHSKCVVHRDLKPSNILLDSNYYPRICDFGSSIMYHDVEQRMKKNERNVGTPIYMAPEIFIDKEPYSFKVDIYSFALIAYQLLTEKQPYYDQKFKSINHLKKCVLDGLRPDLSIIPDDEICAFFTRCWSSEPSERPTAKELYDIIQTNKFKRIYQCDVNEMVQFLSWCGNNNLENQKLSTTELRKSHLKGDERSSIMYANVLFGGGRKKEAIQIIKKIADHGNPEGMFLYAMFINDRDIKLSNIYLKKAADKGHAKAMVNYGNNLLIGNGVDIDYKESTRYYKMAADLQDDEGLFAYGINLSKGRGIKQNKKEAAYYIQLSADLGNVNGMYQYAFLLKNGDGIERDFEKAAKYYEKAAFYGDIEAMLNLGSMYYDGSLPFDFKKASHYFKMAIDLGNDKAMFNYGNILCTRALTGNYTTNEQEEMFEKAAKLFKMAADMGNIEAATQYGGLYSKGLLQFDSLEPIEYLKKAAYELNDDALIEYGAFLVKENPIIQLNFKLKAFIIDLMDIGFSDFMIRRLINDIKERIAANEMCSKNKKLRKYFNMDSNSSDDDDDDDDSDSSDSDTIEFNCHLNELFDDDDEQNDNDNNNNNNNDEQNDNDNNNNNNNDGDEPNINDDDEIVNNEKVLFETFMECQKQGLSPKETSSILAIIQRRLEHKFICSNDKDSIPEEKLTVSYLRQIVRNLIGKPDETTEKDTIPDLKGKTIHDVKINLYKSYEFEPILYYIYLSHFTIPEPIRDEINQELKASPFYQYSAQSLCHQKDPNDIYDFYFFTPFVSIQNVHSCLTKVMKKYGFESYIAPIQETLPFENYLYFSESMLPDETLTLLLKFLNAHQDVEEIKNNIFDGKQIATHIIIKRNSYVNVIKSIDKLLTQQGILFDSSIYPLQNNIIINEKMILQEKNDFYVILNEIKSLKIEPINIERDKLYLYNYYFVRKLFQRFSFICFKNEIEKMRVVNHLNSILYKDKSNVLQYNIEYIYAAIDDHFYPENVREQIPKIINSFKGVMDFQHYVVSVESPVEKSYIGFDNINHLKKCHYKFVYKLNILLSCIEPKLFWRKKNLHYLYLRSKDKFSSDFDVFINNRIIEFSIADIQKNCTDLEYSSPEEFEQVYSTYLGFDSIEKMQKAFKILLKKQIPNRSDVKIGIYKEGNSYINISYETRELYLFYESL